MEEEERPADPDAPEPFLPPRTRAAAVASAATTQANPAACAGSVSRLRSAARRERPSEPQPQASRPSEPAAAARLELVVAAHRFEPPPPPPPPPPQPPRHPQAGIFYPAPNSPEWRFLREPPSLFYLPSQRMVHLIASTSSQLAAQVDDMAGPGPSLRLGRRLSKAEEGELAYERQQISKAWR